MPTASSKMTVGCGFCRTMYLARSPNVPFQCFVCQTEMDGSNPANISLEYGQPQAIQVDLETRRIYWADILNRNIQSSNLDGSEPQSIHEFQDRLTGLAVLGDRLYWSRLQTIESSNVEPGSEIRVEQEHTGYTSVGYLTVPLWNPPGNRTNHCEGVACEGVCVLTSTSYRCLAAAEMS